MACTTSPVWHGAVPGGAICSAPPRLAFALNFSAFTTKALMVDFDRTPAQIGALTAEILKVMLTGPCAARADDLCRGPDREKAEPGPGAPAGLRHPGRSGGGSVTGRSDSVGRDQERHR